MFQNSFDGMNMTDDKNVKQRKQRIFESLSSRNKERILKRENRRVKRRLKLNKNNNNIDINNGRCIDSYESKNRKLYMHNSSPNNNNNNNANEFPDIETHLDSESEDIFSDEDAKYSLVESLKNLQKEDVYEEKEELSEICPLDNIPKDMKFKDLNSYFKQIEDSLPYKEYQCNERIGLLDV